MSLRNTVHLTTLEMSLPASARMALTFSQQAAVCTAMLPVTSCPSGSPGIWPDTKMKPPATMACVCEMRAAVRFLFIYFFSLGREEDICEGEKGWGELT